MMPLSISGLLSRHNSPRTLLHRTLGASVSLPFGQLASKRHEASSVGEGQHRNFSAPAPNGNRAKKQVAKERRRAIYESRQERKARLATRRAGKPFGQKRNEFRSWFIPKKVNEEYMNRKARQAGLDWKIRVAVILERINVVLPDREDWEVEYDKLQAHLMQFGKMYPQELFKVDYEAERPLTQEELLENLPEGFVPAPRETEADATGDVKTTDRKLKTEIFLLVKDETTENGLWKLPETELRSEETLLDAAKRAVLEAAGEEVEFWCPSNCPCAVDVVAEDEKDRTGGFYGTKTFFIKVQYDDGQVQREKDFAWLDRGEIVERIQEERGDAAGKFYRYLL